MIHVQPARRSIRGSKGPRGLRSVLRGLVTPIALGTLLGLGDGASAQTDFHSLDKGRPLRVEDAYAAKRHAFELQFSPLTLAQDGGGILRYAPGLELKHGFLPGAEGSLGIGIEIVREGERVRARMGSIDLSTLVNLWVEGPSLPAAGLRLTTHLPTDSGQGSTLEGRVLLTRSLAGPVRAHLNAGAVVGRDRTETVWAGLALDHTLPFRHTLLLAEGWIAGTPAGSAVVHTAAGMRFQLTPTLVLDGGAGRSWSGEGREAWALTVGVTREFGILALTPRRRP